MEGLENTTEQNMEREVTPGGKASVAIGEALRVLPPNKPVTAVTVTPSSSFTTKIHLTPPPKCSPGSLREL